MTDTFVDAIADKKADLMDGAFEVDDKIKDMTDLKLEKLKNITETTKSAFDKLKGKNVTKEDAPHDEPIFQNGVTTAAEESSLAPIEETTPAEEPTTFGE